MPQLIPTDDADKICLNTWLLIKVLMYIITLIKLNTFMLGT